VPIAPLAPATKILISILLVSHHPRFTGPTCMTDHEARM
jgi:hypothetical protein